MVYESDTVFNGLAFAGTRMNSRGFPGSGSETAKFKDPESVRAHSQRNTDIRRNNSLRGIEK